ncbi:MAG: selenocysteine synthase [Acidobacteria bacterium]|nr:selenocysteine synthase [Acidobacteriota bacterium]
MIWKNANRRKFLGSLAGLPLVGGLLPSAASAAARSGAAERDLIAELGVQSFINAAGTYTTLTASLMPPEVIGAITSAATKYVNLIELHDAVGKRIAELVKAESALVSAGCASALSQATAACVAGADRDKIQMLPDTHHMKNEVICQKSHRNGYDHAIRNAGVTMIEVETAQELERAVNHKTAMMFYLNHATPEGKIKHEEFVALGKKHGIPTLIDAAADVPPVENLYKFQGLGFDLVAFSGGKGMRGPQSAGLLLGRKDLIAAARMNASPNSDSLCRTNKVNKEELVGMLAAVERFVKLDHEAEWKMWEKRCDVVAKEVKKAKTVQTKVFVPEIANAVPHLEVTWDEAKVGRTREQVVEGLRKGSPNIELRPGGGKGLVVVAVSMMQDGDEDVVARRLREELKG